MSQRKGHSLKKKKHDWNSLHNYLVVHDRVLRWYQKYMEIPRSYSKKWFTPNWLELKCEKIYFQTFKGNRIRVDIHKDIDVDDTNPRRKRARIAHYSYSANVPGVKRQALVRYDSPHEDRISKDAPRHHKFHHKHECVGETREITLIGDDDFPHVNEFFNEVLKNY